MGNCKCEIHYHGKNNEAFFNEIINPNINKSINTNKESIINSLERKDSLGIYLEISDFKSLINQKILTYIETNKLNYQEYYTFSSSNIYKSNPIQFKNGNIYYGNWNINKEMEGYGIYLIKNKNIITEGIWKQGIIKYGRIFFPNGDIYEGSIKNYFSQGEGNTNFMNGESFSGEFIIRTIIGKGIFTFSDNSYYCGEIENGIFKGEGKMIWNDGTEYHGIFVNSSLSGKGEIFNNLTGEKYIGNFMNNEFNGKGIYYYKNGDIYEGNFEYGEKKGKGKYKRSDNVEFELIWNNNYPNGLGVATYNNNKIKGFWRNGNFLENFEVIEGKLENFKGKDLNLKCFRRTLIPNKLPHLANNDMEISQFILGTEII